MAEIAMLPNHDEFTYQTIVFFVVAHEVIIFLKIRHSAWMS